MKRYDNRTPRSTRSNLNCESLERREMMTANVLGDWDLTPIVLESNLAPQMVVTSILSTNRTSFGGASGSTPNVHSNAPALSMIDDAFANYCGVGTDFPIFTGVSP